MVRDYLGDYYTPEDKLYIPMIGAIMRSSSKLCIVQMQDYLGLDSSTRMNVPSSVGKNWRWRLQFSQLTDELQTRIKSVTELCGRLKK